MASPKQGEALTILKKKLCRVYCLICFLAINPLTVRDWNAGDEVVYPNVEDNAALLLIFPVKDHPFNDGCKRIGAALFPEFLQKNGTLYTKPDRLFPQCPCCDYFDAGRVKA